ncbi:MAG: hypothetical protein AB1347_09685 [Acidobacteriota bacterium]
MTYNFDPETWLENQKRALDARRRAGEFGEAAHREALEELEVRYEAMVARLDGTFTIPPAASRTQAS